MGDIVCKCKQIVVAQQTSSWNIELLKDPVILLIGSGLLITCLFILAKSKIKVKRQGAVWEISLNDESKNT